MGIYKAVTSRSVTSFLAQGNHCCLPLGLCLSQLNVMMRPRVYHYSRVPPIFDSTEQANPNRPHPWPAQQDSHSQPTLQPLETWRGASPGHSARTSRSSPALSAPPELHRRSQRVLRLSYPGVYSLCAVSTPAA
ncbi:hypothetical protein M758_9G089000 [Ceratodon purpureus]|nr:hypothetical protein M758_9G089000 [Ceratodon purpureus]